MAGKHIVKAQLEENETVKRVEMPTDYEYFISNIGKVYVTQDGGLYQVATSVNNAGYECVLLRIDNKYYCRTVHRLVAMTFIPNPENLKDVNHKNENKLDNRVENLEWMSHGDNMRYSKKTNLEERTINQMIESYGLCKSVITNNKELSLTRKCRKVYCFDTVSDKEIIYESAKQAAEIYGLLPTEIYYFINHNKMKNNLKFSYESFNK